MRPNTENSNTFLDYLSLFVIHTLHISSQVFEEKWQDYSVEEEDQEYRTHPHVWDWFGSVRLEEDPSRPHQSDRIIDSFHLDGLADGYDFARVQAENLLHPEVLLDDGRTYV